MVGHQEGRTKNRVTISRSAHPFQPTQSGSHRVVSMRLLSLSAALCAALLLPHAAAAVPPAPPGDFAFEWAEPDYIAFSWTAPEFTGLSALSHYKFYVTKDGEKLPPPSIPISETGYEYGYLQTGSLYTFHLTAVNLDGDESIPGGVLFVKGGYPHCTWFSYSISPPHADPQPACLIP